MGAIRKGGELKMGTIDGVAIKCGSTNRKEPDVIYMVGKTWVKPNIECNFESSIALVRRNMERRIKIALNTFDDFENKYIFDFSLTPLNMEVGKPKFMQFQIFLRQNKRKMREFRKIKDILNETMTPIVRAMINDFNDNDFDLTIHKL